MSDSIPVWAKISIVVAALASAATGVYYLSNPADEPKPAPIAAPAQAPIASTPAIKYPVPETASTQEPAAPPLPELYDSDVSAVADLLSLFDHPAVAALIKPEFLIPRIVATIDNLPNQKLNSNALPIKPVPGNFVVTTSEGEVFIDEANAARYDVYVDAFTSADSAALIALYRRWYPLFQQAYREQGDPSAYFNDRLVEVIDHMLQAPDATPPIELLKPRSNWEYADAELQAASIGHRLMFRIGPAHAARVKAKLAELRVGITEFVPTP